LVPRRPRVSARVPEERGRQSDRAGEVAEWSKAAVSKTVIPFGYLGFESLPLRFTFSPIPNILIDNQL
jgi:hypothetical protein